MATFSSSTSAAANPSFKSYKIFINHHGKDVKETFARSLYLRLLDKGLTPFLDEGEMQAGYEISSQLEHVIRNASVHVAILSPRYAGSDWCLNELVMMLQSNAPVIPVFYRVKPADVRWMLGLYGEALQYLEMKRRHDTNERRHDIKTTMEWRKALHRVANNSGFELKSTSEGEELGFELLDQLVERLSEMVLKPGLHVADYSTGLGLKLKDFEDTVLVQTEQSGKAQILGIVGLGGVGKTTLAKAFFNTKRSGYDKSCFLADVGDHASKGSLHLLQSQLLNSLNGWDNKVNNVHEGRGMLEEPLGHFKALIVLDDVDNVDQVNAFLPFQTFYGNLNSQSLILVTSRDRGVLRNSRVEDSSIYKLSGLNEEHSQELFCSYAFSQANPIPAFEPLVYKFLKCCDGSPLSLRIVGALLSTKEKISEWEDELEVLKEILPSEIKKILYRSYSSLDAQEKDIFLDIACFFIGENRDSAISIWNGSDWRGKRGFLNLQDKSLVEVDDRNCIRMHDHVRDLGREVAATSSPRRVWQTKRVIDYLSQQPFGITVRGIRLVEGEFGGDDLCDIIETENDGWNRILRSLQILHIEGSLLESILRRVKLPNLLWLSWRECPYSSLPSLVTMKKLRVLRVDESRLQTLSDSECESSLPASLEELHASRCLSLKSIPVPAQATKLRFLDVSWCYQLEELPSMETFLCLEELVAYDCVSLKSIRGSAQATKLRVLDVFGCSHLEELPTMETLLCLEKLEAQGCERLKSIRGSAQATKLRLLDVSGCFHLEELPTMETFLCLEKLKAQACESLKSIRGSAQATKLRSLDVSGCSHLEELPSLENMVSLSQLWAEGCMKLKSIHGLAQATKLTHLNVSGCSELEELPSMEKLVSLVELRVGGCLKLKSIRGLTQATELKNLNVSGCSELEELPSLENMVSLSQLWAEGCLKLKSIHGLAQATELIFLDVSGWSELEELPGIERLVSLQGLWADGCNKLKSIRGLGQTTNLRTLSVSWCSELEELPSMEELVSLERFYADGCVKLRRIRGLEHATNIKVMDVSWCLELEEVEGVEDFTWLEMLDVSKCPKLQCPVWE